MRIVGQSCISVPAAPIRSLKTILSNYKSNTGSCNIHYIRKVTLYKRALKCIQRSLTYVQLFRDDFIHEMLLQDEAGRKTELAQKQSTLSAAKKRMPELDKIIQRLYEDTVLGLLSEARYIKLSSQYEKRSRRRFSSSQRHWNRRSAEVRNKLQMLAAFSNLQRSILTCRNWMRLRSTS